MDAFVIANYTVHSPEIYAEYPMRAAATVAQYGGTTIAVEHSPLVLEGKPQSIIVVVRFESVEAAERWYHSPEYQKCIHFRKEAADGWVTICQEFDFSMMAKK